MLIQKWTDLPEWVRDGATFIPTLGGTIFAVARSTRVKDWMVDELDGKLNWGGPYRQHSTGFNLWDVSLPQYLYEVVRNERLARPDSSWRNTVEPTKPRDDSPTE